MAEAPDELVASLEAEMRGLSEDWAVDHARRLLELAARVGPDVAHDHRVLTLAAWTHDWGAFAHHAVPGTEHAVRSAAVVEARLDGWGLDGAARAALLEAISHHDYRDVRPVRSPEALLLREADMLDMLGVVGMARDFTWGPRELAVCRERIRHRLDTIPGRLTLPIARELGRRRAGRMATALAWFDAELDSLD